jgi:two-component system nitrate/nitrite response regulator NarL
VLKASLEHAGFEVAGIATSGRQALEMVLPDPPDVLLIDIGLPDESGLAVGKKIRELVPGARMLALTALDDPRLAQQSSRMGFSGYLTKDIAVSRVVAALWAVLEGRSVRSNGMAAQRGNGSHMDLLAQQLTTREREVLGLLVEGLGGQAIGRRLGVSSNTVRTHVQNILSKLQVHSRLEAATLAVRHRLLDVGLSRRP